MIALARSVRSRAALVFGWERVSTRASTEGETNNEERLLPVIALARSLRSRTALVFRGKRIRHLWGRRGAILGRLGAILGPFGANLGPVWSRLGPSWGRLGAVLGPSWVLRWVRRAILGFKMGMMSENVEKP